MKLRNAADILGLLGPRWLAYRAWHAFERRAGLLRRRAPVADWGHLPLRHFVALPERATPERLARELNEGRRFLFEPGDRARFQPLLEGFDESNDWPVRRLEEIAAGRLRYFSGEPRRCGWPPLWLESAISGHEANDVRHFSRISEFGFGDVKTIWEPNRFGFVFDLVRIHWRIGDERCAAMFWEAVEDWRRHNPPNAGINWKCGQEASLRAFAWCFGLWGFLDSPETTPERLAGLATMLAITGRRVESNLRYAVSQQNNHGISEAAGLLTIGLLLPMLRESDRWERTGRRLLEQQVEELVYEDGGFSQYSANYQRVMLDDFIWALRLADVAGRPLSERLRERVILGGRFLLAIQDRSTGGVPRFGHDDGALVLPLSRCAYEDYRPVIQATAALESEGTLPFQPGPWNEKLLWLFGPEALERAVQPRATGDAWKGSGYGLLRRDDSFAFVRGGRFRHRPSQADLLHMDVWWRGRNVAMDPGTYSYHGPDHWSSIPFAETAVHNTVGVDGRDQADRVRRFLFLPWPEARRRRQLRSPRGEIGLLELEHDGYRRLPDPVSHRRTVVQLGRQHWLVADQLVAEREHDYRLHWLFADAPVEFDEAGGRLRLAYDEGIYAACVLADGALALDLVRGDEGSARGWYAPRYQRLAPALSLAARARGRRFRFYTLLGPGDWTVGQSEEGDRLRVEAGDWRAAIDLAPDHVSDPITSVRWVGRERDELHLV